VGHCDWLVAWSMWLSVLLCPKAYAHFTIPRRSLGSRVVSVLEGPRFKSQSRRCRVTVLGKLFTPIVPQFTKQQNWYQPS